MVLDFLAVDDFDFTRKIIILGPDSPVKLLGHQMVASYDKTKLYTIGNNDPDHSNEIYQLSCGDKSMTDCEWTEMATKLQDGRHYHVAFLISNDLTQKICN